MHLYVFHIDSQVLIGNLTSYIIKTFTDGFTWYRIYSDYWVEQGGYNNPNLKTVTFPVKMADTNYLIINSAEENVSSISNHYWCYELVNNRTTTTVDFINLTDNINIHWEVKGYGDKSFIDNLIQ